MQTYNQISFNAPQGNIFSGLLSLRGLVSPLHRDSLIHETIRFTLLVVGALGVILVGNLGPIWLAGALLDFLSFLPPTNIRSDIRALSRPIAINILHAKQRSIIEPGIQHPQHCLPCVRSHYEGVEAHARLGDLLRWLRFDPIRTRRPDDRGTSRPRKFAEPPQTTTR